MRDAQGDSVGYPLTKSVEAERPRRRKSLERLNVRSLPALGAFYYIELHCLAFLKALKAAGIDRRVVYEHVLAVLAANKAKSLRVIEPLYCSLFHVVSFLRFQLDELP